MRNFKVDGGPVQIGQGEHLLLHADQVKPRKHLLRIINKQDDGASLVEALSLLTFKAGEVIGLKEAPKHARERMIDIRAAEQAAAKAAAAPANLPPTSAKPAAAKPAAAAATKSA